MTRRWVVTGCLGFLGQALTEALLRRGDWVWGIDAQTYAADPSAIGRLQAFPTFVPCKADLVTLDRIPDVDGVLHCAAETHVDNSLADASVFVRTNVLGTQRLLDLLRGKPERPLLVHVSTDEVLGSHHLPRHPDDPYRPSNPYSASKAGAEMLVLAAIRTFQLRARLVRPTNLYGPRQYPEKLIPKAVRRLASGRPVPIHGDGSARRSWLDLGDAVQGLLTVLDRGEDGQVYHLGGNTNATVREVVAAIAAALGVSPLPTLTGGTPIAAYEYQRPGLDLNYVLDDHATRALGWAPEGHLFRDLPALVASLAAEERLR